MHVANLRVQHQLHFDVRAPVRQDVQDLQASAQRRIEEGEGEPYTRLWRLFTHLCMYLAHTCVCAQVSEGVIASLIMLIVALEIGLMVVWAAVDPLKGVRNEEKNNEYMLDSAVGKDYEWVECAYESGGGTVGLLNVVWKAIIIGYGCHISWGTRNYDLYIAEGKYIMVAMYQMALLAVIAGSVMVMGVSPVVAATVQCFASVVGSMSLVCLVVVPKLFMVGMTRENLMERTVSSATGGAATTAAGSGNTEEMAGLTGEIKDLKEEIRRLKGE